MKSLGVFKDHEYPLTTINHTRRSVRAILINDQNQFAFLRIVGEDEFGYRNHIESIGGGIEKDEDFHMALLREIKEETGIVGEIIAPLGIIEDDYNLIHRHNISYFFLVKVHQVLLVTQRSATEQMLFKGVVWYSYNQAIINCEYEAVGKIGRLIQRRDALALQEAWSLIQDQQ